MFLHASLNVLKHEIRLNDM